MDETGKMSKSKGAILTVSTLKEKGYNPLSFRYMCLSSHYRKQLVFNYESLDNASTSYEKLLGKIKSIKEKASGEINKENIKSFQDKFKEALENDLNTSLALTTLYNVIKSDLNNNEKIYLIEDFDKVLSLDLLKDKEIEKDLKKYIEEKIEERNKAKKEKNYELADKIREELLEKNITIKDTREGTTYEIKWMA